MSQRKNRSVNQLLGVRDVQVHEHFIGMIDDSQLLAVPLLWENFCI